MAGFTWLLVIASRADGLFNWFHPFRHGNCPVVCPQPVQPYVGVWQAGLFNARFFVPCPFYGDKCTARHDGYCDHWVEGSVCGDGWIYWTKLVPDPFHPGVTTDVELILKDLENDVLNIFHKRHDQLVAPKVEDKK